MSETTIESMINNVINTPDDFNDEERKVLMAVKERIAELEQQLTDRTDALRHIIKVCEGSRQQSRRIRWIAARSKGGIEGTTEWQKVDFPKSGNSASKKLRVSDITNNKLKQQNTDLQSSNEDLQHTVNALRGLWPGDEIMRDKSGGSIGFKDEVIEIVTRTPAQHTAEHDKAVIDGSFEKKIHDVLFAHIDRLNDPCPKVDPLEKIVNDLISEFDKVWRPHANTLRQDKESS